MVKKNRIPLPSDVPKRSIDSRACELESQLRILC